jgi:drug/metabolite transporter (DMT)-like permease
MALVTAVCFASFAVIVRHNRRIDMLPTILVSATIIGLVSLAVSFDDLGITVRDLLLCLLWGGLLSGFANWMFIVASRHLVAAEVTLFMLLEFSLGPVWVWLFAAEVPSEWTILGGLLVIAAVALRAGLELRGTGRRLRRGRPSPG